MTRYAVGYAVVLLVLAAGSLIFVIDTPGPSQPPEVRPNPSPELMSPPVELLVSGLNSEMALGPVSYCWDDGLSEEQCGTGEGFQGPILVHTETDPVIFSFEVEWHQLTLEVQQDQSARSGCRHEFGPTSELRLPPPGIAGDYLVWLRGQHDWGEAEWEVAVRNRGLLVGPNDVPCPQFIESPWAPRFPLPLEIEEAHLMGVTDPDSTLVVEPVSFCGADSEACDSIPSAAPPTFFTSEESIVLIFGADWEEMHVRVDSNNGECTTEFDLAAPAEFRSRALTSLAAPMNEVTVTATGEVGTIEWVMLVDNSTAEDPTC